MLIKAVELENAKSYDQARVEFTEGVNAIVGHNGAGKSTILETIGLVLFDASGYTRSEFVRNGARTATMTVEVESSFDGRPYHVVRRIGGTNQHYIFDPELDLRVCEGKADVLAFLRQHMGLDSRANLETLFKDAVGVAQGTFTAAFLLTAGQRKGIFGPLLQVDDYQKAVDKLLEPLRLVQSRGQELDLSIATMQTRLERLPAVEAEVAAQAEELERLSRQAAEVRGLLEAAVARADALDAVRQELAALQSKHVQAQQRQEGWQRQSAAAAQALADAEAAQAAVEKNQEGSRRYLAAQEEQKRLDARLRQRTRLEEEARQGRYGGGAGRKRVGAAATGPERDRTGARHSRGSAFGGGGAGERGTPARRGAPAGCTAARCAGGCGAASAAARASGNEARQLASVGGALGRTGWRRGGRLCRPKPTNCGAASKSCVRRTPTCAPARRR